MVTRAESVVAEAFVLGVNDTLPVPTIQLAGPGGAVMTDLTGYTAAVMEFFDAAGNSFTETGTIDPGGTITFPLTPANTAEATYRHTYVRLTNTDGVFTLPGPPFAVVDYSTLWASPSEVFALVEDDNYTNSQLLFAILAAEGAVRAWVSTPIASPVGERVRRATALLAARALTTLPLGDRVASEQMGDYSVRYVDPSGSGLIIDGDIADLLSPWRGKVLSTYIGPDTGRGMSDFTELWVEG